ncbi:MAG: D-hexose-6-phosphate mutarotase [Candidatus Competibacteraceae bacterium]|nr:D-hexose-6-phosphate mutarotase [Candidatus Competibacteraceae bacterium]
MSPPNSDSLSTITPGAGDLPKLTLMAPDGAQAEIYLHGAHVTSWIPASGQERLFLSRASQFRADAPIRGGIPVVFPQFGMLVPLPLHGLARLMLWEFVEAKKAGTGASATFRLHDTEESRRLWTNAFLAELTLAIDGNQLAVTLAILNTGTDSFTFTAAFHTYLAVTDLAATVVEKLAGVRYRDAAADGIESHQISPQVGFAGEVNRIYFDAPTELRLVEPDRTTHIRSEGFPDTVVWNPAAAKCATMSDLALNDYQRFVCVEAGVIGTPVSLAPGARWQGVQTLLV